MVDLPKRTVECYTCGFYSRVDYNSSTWDITDSCPKCAAVKTANPELFEWILSVVNKNKMTSTEVEKIIEDRLNPGGYY